MPKLKLSKVVNTEDKAGNPIGFGPGEVDVPQEYVELCQKRKAIIEPKEERKEAATPKTK